MRLGERRVEADRFEQQTQRLLLPALRSVKLRQVEIWPRVPRLARNPSALLVHLAFGLIAERPLDHLIAPETHRCSRPHAYALADRPAAMVSGALRAIGFLAARRPAAGFRRHSVHRAASVPLENAAAQCSRNSAVFLR